MFLVTMKATEIGKKIVSLHLPNNTLVEVVPTEGSVQVTVDAEPIILPEDGNHHIIADPETGKEIMRFVPKFNGVIIFSFKYGLLLDTDGHQVFFKAAEFYRDQTCGICGNFDGSLYKELEGPNAEIFPDQEHFLSSYTIPTEGCEAPLNTNITCERVLRNIVFERYIDGEQNICISTEPTSHCTGHCEPAATVQHDSAGFHCMPAYLSAAQHLREDALTGPLHLTHVEANMHETITEDQDCLPAY